MTRIPETAMERLSVEQQRDFPRAPVNDPSYLFHDAEADAERERLRVLEALFDPASRRLLDATGVTEGWRCLEVGAGAGSIARWLADRVAPSGHVIALDRNCRFLSADTTRIMEIREGDVREADIPESSLDLIHARHVLIHLRRGETLIPVLWRWLKPGGWIALEEPDFSFMRAYVASPQEREAFDRIVRAIRAIYRSRDSDPVFGAQLPQAMSDLGADQLIVEHDGPVVRGGSLLARLMSMSAEHLSVAYRETGHASREDITTYQSVLDDSSALVSYYSVVRVAARKASR